MAIPVTVSAINPGPVSFSLGNGWTAYQEYTPDGLVQRVVNSKGQQAKNGYDPTENDGWLPFFDANIGDGWVNGKGQYSSAKPNADWNSWKKRAVEGTFGEALNPATQQWEPMVEVDTENGTKNNGVMPKSVAQRLYPSGAYTAQNIPFKGGFMDDLGANLVLPGLSAAVGSLLTPGISNIFNGNTGLGSLVDSNALAAGESATTGLGSVYTPDALGAAQTVYSTGSPLISPALETAMNSPGANMNFFDELLGLTDSTDMTGFYTPSDTLNLGSSTLDNSSWNLGTGSGDLTSPALDNTLPNTGVVPNGYTVDLSNSGNLIPAAGAGVDVLGQLKKILNAYKTVSGAAGATGTPRGSLGSSVMNQITNDPLQAAFNATPFLLALQQANSQGGDLKATLDKIQGLADGVSGNSSALTTAVLNPYDQATATGLGNLTQSLGSRGVLGSSFGDISLDNYNYTRDMGRGDLLAKTKLASTGLEADLLTKVLSGQNTANTNKNLLLGAGLSASGRLFQPESDPFGLKALLGA